MKIKDHTTKIQSEKRDRTNDKKYKKGTNEK